MTTKTLEELTALGAADASALLNTAPDSDESAAAFTRFDDAVQDVDPETTQGTPNSQAYVVGFRSVMDAHLAKLFPVASGDSEGHVLSCGPEYRLSVFNEGGWFVWYKDDREHLAYDPNYTGHD